MIACANPACRKPLVRRSSAEPMSHFRLRKYCGRRCANQGQSLAAWPEAESARLEEMWRAGLSGNRIARELGRTKNQIVGRAHRLGLERRPSPIRPNSALAAPPKRREPPASQPSAREPSGCRWPCWPDGVRPGEPGYGRFCGKPKATGEYCRTHAEKAWPAIRKRDEPREAVA